MELRVLRYFLAVAEEGNITWAAQLLRISQPTLSRQLKQLEEELGVTLFERGSHTITLTEEGRLLRECAQTKPIRVPAHRHYRALVSDGSRKPPAGGTRIVDPAESQGCAAAVPAAHARTQSAAELVRAIRRSGESEHRRLLLTDQQRRRYGDQWIGYFPRVRFGHVLPRRSCHAALPRPANRLGYRLEEASLDFTRRRRIRPIPAELETTKSVPEHPYLFIILD